MTKKAFKYDMQRGLGSCTAALKNMQDAEKETFLPLVLWGCSRDMAFDAQCEGCRSVYLYELISEFPDKAPFMDVIEKRLFHGIHSSGWEFQQDCELLAYFVSDGVKRAWKILTACYRFLLVSLDEYDPDQNRLFSERDNFQSLCVTLVSLCFDDRRKREKIYQKIVRDLCILGEENPLLTVEYFDWFQHVSEKCLGKRTIHKLLYCADAEDYMKTYARLLEECQNMRAEWRKQKREEPETAEELYRLLKTGKKPGKEWPLLLACGWMKRNKEQEVVRLAAYYKDEKGWDIRCQILRMLAKKECAWTLDLPQLLADSRSEHSELSEWAFTALRYRRDTKVRAYALELLQKGTHTDEAVSMLAKNYAACDKEIFADAVKQIPITYWDTGWHGVFSDIIDFFEEPGKGRPNELLFYMYQNTLCSFCREYIVKQMGRRRMITCELLEEMQYDCNEKIRMYARRKLSCIHSD
ncbi:MAG: hypothetical protein K2K74_03635 [Lachnospiraceae bacterium]|nr:hypothetical protein [Lachnospiraceae bacterium]